jgi:hypothetical protein
MPEVNFVWYELLTPDPEGAKRFYDRVVGWDIEPTPSMPEMDYRMIRRSGGGNAGGVMRLGEDMQQHAAGPIWLGYIGVGDVDATIAAIEADGGKAIMGPFEVPDVGRIAMVSDPAGVPFYIIKPVAAAAGESDAFSVDQPQHVRWNELSTSDPEGAVAFYARHFGWVQEGDMDMGEFGKYRFIQHNGVAIGAIMAKMPQMPVGLWSYYIGVDDIARAEAAVKESGGQIVNGPVEIPGGEFALNGVDPQGAAFALVGPRRS